MGSRELARRGHTVAIAAPGDGELARRAREAGLQVFGEFGFFKPRHLRSLVRDVATLRRVLREFKPDLIHSHGSQDTWTSVLANRFGGPRVAHVLTRHNSKRISYHPGNRYLYGHAIDLLVVVSRGVLERFEEFFRGGVLDPARIPVIPSSIDFARYDRPIDAEKLRRELGVGDEVPLVGSVGRLVRDKGQHVLLRAFATVRRQRPGSRLVLAGTGTEEGALKALAAELGIADAVHFLGFRNDVPEVTAALDAAVLASVDCDASPAVVKEAMYLQKPVIVTDIGGLREMVEDGATGRVVPPGEPVPLAEAILDMLAGGDAVREMGRRAREVVASRYSLGALADAYERAYGNLIAERKLDR
jgi:glycosyltransferase involved in cell wall biosynthesis